MEQKSRWILRNYYNYMYIIGKVAKSKFFLKSFIKQETKIIVRPDIIQFNLYIFRVRRVHSDKILGFRHPETDVIIWAFRKVRKHSPRTLLPWRDAIVAAGSALVSRRETRSQRAGSISFVTHVGRFVARLTQHPGQSARVTSKRATRQEEEQRMKYRAISKDRPLFLFSSLRCCAIITRLVLAAIVVNSRDR